MQHPTREQWLNQAIERYFGRLFDRLGIPLPPVRAWAASRYTQGEAWDHAQPFGGPVHIFIDAGVCDPITALATLLHELVHAAIGHEAGHGPQFQQIASATGLNPPWNETQPSPRLQRQLAVIAERLGKFPAVTVTECRRAEQVMRGCRMLARDYNPGAVPRRLTKKITRVV